jgi:hypothetical protein
MVLPVAPAAQNNSLVDDVDEAMEVYEETGFKDPDRFKKGVIDHLQRGRTQGIPKLAEKIAIIKAAADSKLAFLSQGFMANNQPLAALLAELAQTFKKKGKPTAEKTDTLLYSLHETIEANNEYAKTTKMAGVATTRNKGKKGVTLKDPTNPGFVDQLRALILAATKAYKDLDDWTPSDDVGKILKYCHPTRNKNGMYDLDAVKSLSMQCPFCAAAGHQSTMVVFEPDNHEEKKKKRHSATRIQCPRCRLELLEQTGKARQEASKEQVAQDESCLYLQSLTQSGQH